MRLTIPAAEGVVVEDDPSAGDVVEDARAQASFPNSFEHFSNG